MSRRSRRLSWTLAVLCTACAALALAGHTDPPAQALAAVRALAAARMSATPTPMPCQPVRGDTLLDAGTLLHVPAKAKSPMPLVIAFHGAGGDGPGMATYSGLSVTADEHGFAVLYPSAASSNHFWSLNAAMHGDDVTRLKALLPQVQAKACTDPRRIYATGVSNGGGFAARVGCELAGTIAAIAPVAGGYRALDPCPQGRRTSVLEIHGTADHVVPYAGLPPDYKGAVAGFLAGWIRRDGCEAKAERIGPSRGVTRFSHDSCAPGLKVEHLRLEGTDHGWPGADPPYPRHNPSELKANDQIWDFFSHVALSASAGASRAARSAG